MTAPSKTSDDFIDTFRASMGRPQNFKFDFGRPVSAPALAASQPNKQDNTNANWPRVPFPSGATATS